MAATFPKRLFERKAAEDAGRTPARRRLGSDAPSAFGDLVAEHIAIFLHPRTSVPHLSRGAPVGLARGQIPKAG
ncbi:MAG: hypothetical protein DYH12_12970 [Sorangiineae bacterium PRO1]|nr:hypothetical protein [Sorangiineae bacterium PRO1]